MIKPIAEIHHKPGKRSIVYADDYLRMSTAYDDNGNNLTYKDSDGYFRESTYDDSGSELTFKHSIRRS